MTAKQPPRCPRCNRPIPAHNRMGPRRKFCGGRSCYDAFYAAKRKAIAAKAEEVMKTEAFATALLAREKELRKEMRQKVSDAQGVEPGGKPLIARPLPRGGALVILNGEERADLMEMIARLDEAVMGAAEVLGRGRLAAHRAVGTELRTARGVLERLGGEHLLGVIPEPRKGSRRG